MVNVFDIGITPDEGSSAVTGASKSMRLHMERIPELAKAVQDLRDWIPRVEMRQWQFTGEVISRGSGGRNKTYETEIHFNICASNAVIGALNFDIKVPIGTNGHFNRPTEDVLKDAVIPLVAGELLRKYAKNLSFYSHFEFWASEVDAMFEPEIVQARRRAQEQILAVFESLDLEQAHHVWFKQHFGADISKRLERFKHLPYELMQELLAEMYVKEVHDR